MRNLSLGNKLGHREPGRVRKNRLRGVNWSFPSNQVETVRRGEAPEAPAASSLGVVTLQCADGGRISLVV